MKYIIHNIAGKILRTGSAPESMVDAQAGPGEHVLPGTADDVQQKIVDGVVVDKTAKEKAAEKRPKILDKDKAANITKGQLAELISRIHDLENTR
ncbi:MAG TPA: hypothetical protein ENH62_12255 [Marinobacter sp.]|uniref:Uncharacterized protein n=1 Tax=marine sediment metagenome TaxID=412755 RepID=A0A0F9QSR3_9ZZZZ|nr:hypothetical protein [Marinobacter sp.]